MMKFLNLNTGCTFDALWTSTQSKGYIFWFPNEQSTNITYTMPLCIVSDQGGDLTVSIDDNDVFSFITHTHNDDGSERTCTVDGYVFNEPEYIYELTLTPEKIDNKHYVYSFNVACCGDMAGEYICKIKIGNDGSFIRVGADLYDEYEPVYVNLSNMGVELPDMIQKAIYDTNVHEDLKDNIIVNRKLKELISNYWDIIANKGSYKSLQNSLKWFEWGDKLKIREIWKHDDAGKVVFSDKDLMSLMENKIKDSFQDFVRTSYVSLYCCLYNEDSTYDAELNPNISNVIFKWTEQDMQLKLALLAQFFGQYFLPIHLSILHATVEDIVFTNTIKTVHANVIKRNDFFGDFNYVECSVKDDSVYKMTNVRAQITKNTRFGVKYDPDNKPNELSYFGVDFFPSVGMVDENSIKTFSQQYYTGPGAIIPFELHIPNQDAHDFIKQTIVDVRVGNDPEKRSVFFDRINSTPISENSTAYEFKMNFNVLLKEANSYVIKFTFITGSSKTITRLVKFVVEDADNININVYKVKSKDDQSGFTYDDFFDTTCGKYIYSIQSGQPDKPYHYHYLPCIDPENTNYSSYKGIKLNRTIVFDVKQSSKEDINAIRQKMQDDYLEFNKKKVDTTKPVYTTIDDKINYLIFVSKRFYAVAPARDDLKQYKVIRDDLVFYPQFHELELIKGDSIDDYMINDYDAICCAAEINTVNGVETFKYGHQLSKRGLEWHFINASTGESFNHPTSSVQPFISKTDGNLLPPGYYDISFKYSLTNGVEHECKLNSAFIVKKRSSYETVCNKSDS